MILKSFNQICYSVQNHVRFFSVLADKETIEPSRWKFCEFDDLFFKWKRTFQERRTMTSWSAFRDFAWNSKRSVVLTQWILFILRPFLDERKIFTNSFILMWRVRSSKVITEEIIECTSNNDQDEKWIIWENAENIDHRYDRVNVERWVNNRGKEKKN